MVEHGTGLENNNALTIYQKEKQRLANLSGASIFDVPTKKVIKSLICLTTMSPDYVNALDSLKTSMTETEYDAQKSAALVKTASVKLKDLLTPMGVCYTDKCGNTVQGHRAFIEANASIEQETGSIFLRAGGYGLYHFVGEAGRTVGTRQPSKESLAAMKALAAKKTTEEGKEK